MLTEFFIIIIIPALAWSQQLPMKTTKWGRVYLAIGTKSGLVRILEIFNGTVTMLKATFNINDQCITSLKWSQAFKSATGECMYTSLLMITCLIYTNQ